MGRLSSFRRSRPLPEVEARIAALAEELPLTAMFVAAMARDGRRRAALGVIDEQRASLRQAQTSMLRALAARRRHRVQAALAGTVAALLVASGSYATVRALRPAPLQKAELIGRATATVEGASRTDSATELAAMVEEVQNTLLALSEDALADPQTQDAVANILGKAQAIVSSAPNAAELLAKVDRVAKKVDVKPSPPEPETPQQAPTVAPPANP